MSKSSTPDFIIGAGLTGLIAAHAWPTARILEKATTATVNHRALLRFRSDAVSRLTGVEFRKVHVRKGIWANRRPAAPSIELANLYSAKVLGGRLEGDRSIWNLDPVDRYVAPDNFHEQLFDSVANRIKYGVDAHDIDFNEGPIVSTIPLSTMIDDVVQDYAPGEVFYRAPIRVHRFKVPRCDLFQTIYYPDPAIGIYRASITGDTLICEWVEDKRPNDGYAMDEVMSSFGINGIQHESVVEQRFGKIAPINESIRRELLFRLTQDYKVYSLGRFATWRNILLDDVVKDIDVIKRLMKSGDAYTHRRAA